MRSQGHRLDVKVKQNDVKIPILCYKFSVCNCVICLLLLEVCFAMCWIVVMVGHRNVKVILSESRSKSVRPLNCSTYLKFYDRCVFIGFSSELSRLYGIKL